MKEDISDIEVSFEDRQIDARVLYDAINHLFPIGRTNFFYCQDCKSYLRICKSCGIYKCNCQKFHISIASFARICNQCYRRWFTR
jgi:hypothetical protein